MMENTYGVFIIRPDGKVLMCHPTGSQPGYRSIPKGLPEEGETPTETAVREVLEETGVILVESSLIPLPPVKYRGRPKILNPFVYLLQEEEYGRVEKSGFGCSSYFELNGREIPEVDGWYWTDMSDPTLNFHHSQKNSYEDWKISISL